ncbi:MAG: single-stranded-DNA-specific exonuclease RecJ [Bradymonadia bacterium]
MTTFRSLAGLPSHTGRPWRRKAASSPNASSSNDIVHRFLATRGLSDLPEVESYLGYSLSNMIDPASMPDATLAADRILAAIASGERVTVYGDYDVDGVTSSALLALAFRSMFNFEIDVYIPHRLKEGYGLNEGAIKHIAEQGSTLMITVDNGSSAQKEIALARTLDLDVIIVDHHQVSDPEPEAYAHLNPHRKSSGYEFKGLAAVGIAFMLLVQVRRRAREQKFAPLGNHRIDQFLDLVALGTVADVAPLVDINRALVRYGLKCIQASPRIGIDALCRVSGVEPEAINEGDLGFKLGPRVNAAGRLENASDGFVLLTETSMDRAQQKAQVIDAQNAQRRVIQAQIEEEALEQAERQMKGEPDILILHGDEWHPGVVGIVASRIVETYQKPVFCLALDGNIWKGSGRSIPGVNLKSLLDECAPVLLRYGGHVAAAGVTLSQAALSEFKSLAQNAVAHVRDDSVQSIRYVDVDLEIGLDELTFELMASMERAGPFGHENPAPRFLLKGVQGKTRLLKGDHLKIQHLEGGAPYLEAIGWGMGACEGLCQSPIDLVCTARVESWRGRRRLTLTIVDLRASEGLEEHHASR